LKKEPSMQLHEYSETARYAVAQSPLTPPETLAALANGDAGIRMYVADNPATPTGTLVALASDGDAVVRGRVGRNHNTPPEVLNALANDGSSFVRSCAAGNPNMSAEGLELLSHDHAREVRGGICDNPGAPPNMLRRLSRDLDNGYSLALNPNTPTDVLIRLSRCGVSDITSMTASHPRLPEYNRLRISMRGVGHWKLPWFLGGYPEQSPLSEKQISAAEERLTGPGFPGTWGALIKAVKKAVVD
jgi:hypothetical protein